MVKKYYSIIISILLIVSFCFLIFQNLELKKYKKNDRLNYLISSHPLPSREIDSLNLLNYLAGKNIPGWGLVQKSDIYYIVARVNTTSTQGSISVFSASRWYGTYNFDFDPMENNVKYDIILFQVRFRKQQFMTPFIGYVECNHTFNNSALVWETNFNLNPEQIREYDRDKDFEGVDGITLTNPNGRPF